MLQQAEMSVLFSPIIPSFYIWQTPSGPREGPDLEPTLIQVTCLWLPKNEYKKSTDSVNVYLWHKCYWIWEIDASV